MAYFDRSTTIREQAFDCLIGTPAGTAVNATIFTKPGKELDLLEYQYILREADIPLAVWIVATVYGQQYNWNTRRGVWVNEFTLAAHAKMEIYEFSKAEEHARDMKWLVSGTDWMTGREANFPAIGESGTPRPEILVGGLQEATFRDNSFNGFWM
jgi:hypothetical protein